MYFFKMKFSFIQKIKKQNKQKLQNSFNPNLYFMGVLTVLDTYVEMNQTDWI